MYIYEKTEVTKHGRKYCYELSSGELATQLRVIIDGITTEIYSQSHGRKTCTLLRNCGEYGFLNCGEMMATAEHLYNDFRNKATEYKAKLQAQIDEILKDPIFN